VELLSFIHPKSTMANVGIVTAQTLPRFLLPKLSWQAGSIGQQSMRTLRTVTATQVHNRGFSDRRKCLVPKQQLDVKQYQFQSRILKSLPQRRSFHATAIRSRDHHFDTLKFVQRLKEEGFTEEQSVAMMKVLSDVIEERCVVLRC
jgi:hypothetical protein